MKEGKALKADRWIDGWIFGRIDRARERERVRTVD